MGWYLDYICEKLDQVEESVNRVTAETDAVMYHDYTFKVKVEAIDGKYRILVKITDLMDQYVDITDKCTKEFQDEMFNNFFKKSA